MRARLAACRSPSAASPSPRPSCWRTMRKPSVACTMSYSSASSCGGVPASAMATRAQAVSSTLMALSGSWRPVM
ncbi:hypothetical protein JaAD80_28380 [Janthinobacterium sp. AD80]|nr:hypothetical protein JaAD80_28380 [Janthinobacterium sp. AD80]